MTSLMGPPGQDPPARVLLADDHALVRSGVRLIIDAEPDLKVVAEVSDGAAAVERLVQGGIDLAILDVSMPGQTGFEICRAVRSDASLDETRLLLLSASVDEKAQAVGRDAGADHFLPKPFSPRALVEWLAVGKEPR